MPCFAMSTNKAQGQTLDFVGIYLADNVFTHGQLYVAFSRAQSLFAVAVYVRDKGFTKNIVYQEVLWKIIGLSTNFFFKFDYKF